MDQAILMELMSKIGEVKSEVTGLRSDVGHLSNDVAVVKQDLADVKQDVKQVSDKVSQLETQLTSLESEAFSIKHIKIFFTWIFSKGGVWALIPALVILNAGLKGIGLPGFDVAIILDFFKTLI